MAEAKQEQKQLSYETFWKKQNAKAPKELPKLADKANGAYRKSIATWRRSLQYAKECGDALCEARKFFRTKGSGPRRWKVWLKQNFDASYESAKVYMRVSRKWDDPRIKEVRQGKMSPKSIAGFLRLLNYQKNADDKQAEIGKPTEIGKKTRDLSEGMTDEDKKKSMLRQELRRNLFGRDLERLTIRELELMIVEWETYLWPKLHREVRTILPLLKNNPYLLDQPEGPFDYETDEETEAINAMMRRTVRNRNQKRKK